MEVAAAGVAPVVPVVVSPLIVASRVVAAHVGPAIIETPIAAVPTVSVSRALGVALITPLNGLLRALTLLFLPGLTLSIVALELTTSLVALAIGPAAAAALSLGGGALGLRRAFRPGRSVSASRPFGAAFAGRAAAASALRARRAGGGRG